MSHGTSLTHRNVLLMIVLTIVTFGFYYPVWFLRRRRALNELRAPRKLAAWPFVASLVVFAMVFLVDFISAPAPSADVIGRGPAMLLGTIHLAAAILMIVQGFFVKDILESHLMTSVEDPGSLTLTNQVKLSGILTFFFTIFYLQHIINRDVVSQVPIAS